MRQQRAVLTPYRVEVLDPDGVHRSVQHDPGVGVLGLGCSAPEHREDAVGPVACIGGARQGAAAGRPNLPTEQGNRRGAASRGAPGALPLAKQSCCGCGSDAFRADALGPAVAAYAGAACHDGCDAAAAAALPVAASMRPNIWGAVMALGFMRHTAVLDPRLDNVAARQSMAALFPEPAGPTTMMPWRTRQVSYSCMTLLIQGPCFWRPRSSTTPAVPPIT